MIQRTINLPRIRLDGKASEYAKYLAKISMRRNPTPEEMEEIDNIGIPLQFFGDAPFELEKGEDYAVSLAYHDGNILKLKLRREFSPSGHMGIAENSIVAGTIFGNRFGYLSSTWERDLPGKYAYDLGVKVSKAMLDQFGIKFNERGVNTK